MWQKTLVNDFNRLVGIDPNGSPLFSLNFHGAYVESCSCHRWRATLQRRAKLFSPS
jgi:hypothetical protein